MLRIDHLSQVRVDYVKKNPKQLKHYYGGWEHTLVKIPDMGIAVRFGEIISRISDHCIPFFYHGCDGCLALR